MLKNLKNVSFLNKHCAVMLAAPRMDHDVIFTLFLVYSKGGLGWGWGREGFLLAKYYEELLLIGCMAWIDNKRQHLPTWDVYLLK
jgi:hypothetical protein